MGMGVAYTALSNDLYGMYYNPAGLAGAPFTQVGGTIGRYVSPFGLISVHTALYTRPLPILPGSTIGAAYQSLHQEGHGSKNEFLSHFSHSFDLSRYYIPTPVQAGANLKVFQSDPGGEANKVGLGIDVGALVEPIRDLRAGLSIRDLSTGNNAPSPAVAFGGAYRIKRRFLFSGDLRIRPGLTEVTPGLEIDFLQRLLKVRLGKGLPVDGRASMVMGLGINYSPIIIDIGATWPSRGAGQYQMSMTYRFGAPAFYGRFVGTAAREAEDLRQEILLLDERRKDMKAQTDAAESERTSVQGQVEAAEDRLRELQRRSRDLDYEIQQKRYEEDHAEPAHSPVIETPAAEDLPPLPPPPSVKPVKTKPKKPSRPRRKFPKRHKVKPGDTLRSIADRYYGDPGLWEVIFEANPQKIERGLPVEGVSLRIPPPPRKR